MGDYRGSYRSSDRGDRGDRGGGGYDRSREAMPPLPTRDMMGSRIYVGKLPNDIKERELEDVFNKYGAVAEIALKGNYAFIQFESSRGAKDAVYEMNNRTLFGDRVQVEHARTPKEIGGSRGGGGGYRESSRYGGGGGGGGGGYDRRDDRGYDRGQDKGYDRGYSGRDRHRDRSPMRGGY